MPQIVEPTSVCGEPESQREIVRLALDEIAADLASQLLDAHLDFPVGLTVPSSGSFLTMFTPLDPSESDRASATAIVRHIVSSKLGGIRLRSRPLPCAMVQAAMGAAEVTADVGTEE
jgi:hypothetical protein